MFYVLQIADIANSIQPNKVMENIKNDNIN